MPGPVVFAEVITKTSIKEKIAALSDEKLTDKKTHDELTQGMKDAMKKALAGTFARERIKREWLRMGGPASQLGLPLDPKFPLLKTNDGGFQIQFLGGNLNTTDANPAVRPSAGTTVIVKLEGIGLIVKQESDPDELYGSISVQVPTLDRKDDIDFPNIKLGPDSNNRVWNDGLILYEGEPRFINMMINMSESDADANRDRVRRMARDAAAQVYEEAKRAAAQAAGIDAETVTNNTLVKQSKLDEMARKYAEEGAQDLLDWIFGTGDDPYGVGHLSISGTEMMNPPPIKQFKCWDDPKLVDYTHQVIVEGYDDGGDRGVIALLFSVKPA